MDDVTKLVAKRTQVRTLRAVEWILVSDVNSKVLKSNENRYEIVKLANTIRSAGGQVTVFRSTKL